MKKLSLYLFFLIVISIFQSCGSGVVVQKPTPKFLTAPNSANLLTVENNGDMKASVAYSTNGRSFLTNEGVVNSKGLDLKYAVGISNHFVAKLDMFYKKEMDVSAEPLNSLNGFKIDYKRRGFFVSGGYYRYLTNNKTIMLTTSVGLGYTKTNFDGIYREAIKHDYFYAGNNFILFIQPSLTLFGSKNYAFTIAYKLSSTAFKNINTNDTTFSVGQNVSLSKKNSVYEDIVIQNEFSFNKLKGFRFYWQTGITNLKTSFPDVQNARYSENSKNNQYDYLINYGSVGLIMDFKKLFTTK
jgi:hypothetical protein